MKNKNILEKEVNLVNTDNTNNTELIKETKNENKGGISKIMSKIVFGSLPRAVSGAVSGAVSEAVSKAISGAVVDTVSAPVSAPTSVPISAPVSAPVSAPISTSVSTSAVTTVLSTVEALRVSPWIVKGDGRIRFRLGIPTSLQRNPDLCANVEIYIYGIGIHGIKLYRKGGKYKLMLPGYRTTDGRYISYIALNDKQKRFLLREVTKAYLENKVGAIFEDKVREDCWIE